LRFLVLSDIHGREKVSRWSNRLIEQQGLDGVIVLGDITHFGPVPWAGEFLDSIQAPSYAVPGNCDPPEVIREIEAHATCLHERKVRLQDHWFGGFGGSNPTIFNTPFELSEQEIEERLRPIMERDMILVVHCPPLGHNDLVPSIRKHAGSTAIKTLVEEFRPRVVLSGHIHEARGIHQEGGTLFMNPGAAKDAYAGILEVDDDIKARLLDRVPEE